MAGTLTSMRKQLLGWFLLVGLAPLILLAIGLQWHLEQALVAEKQAQLYTMAQEKGRLVRERVLAVKGQAEQAAMLPSITRLLIEATNPQQEKMVAEFSHRFLSLNGHYDLLLVNTAGKVVFSVMGESDSGADLTSADWINTPAGIAFDQAKSLLTTVITPFRWYEPSARRASFIGTPVWDSKGTWVGVLLVQLNDDWLSSISRSQVGLGATGEVVLAQYNSRHKLVAAAPLRFSPQAVQEGVELDDQHSIPANRAIRGEEGRGAGIDYRGQPVLAGWVTIPYLQMALVVKQDADETLEPMMTQRYAIVVVVLFLLGFVAWIMVLVSRYFVRPVQRVAQISSQLAQGHWHIRLPESQVQNLEVYQLEQSVNQLAQTIEAQLDQLQAQATELEEQATELAAYNYNLESLVAERTRELERLSIVDPMTGLFNRRHYMSEAPKLWRQAARGQHLLLFVLLDVDKFKEYNDTQGHQLGDNALIRVASVLQEVCRRSSDLVFRMGGEEMAVLSLVKDEQEAQVMAQRILSSVELCGIPHPASTVLPVVTVSLGLAFFDGVACSSPTEPSIDVLYALADSALYQAKMTGRNRAVFAPKKVMC